MKYLHGFHRAEQNRLYTQARLIEVETFGGVDFSKAKKIIEIGCGVGAQTEILIERFPHLEIFALDASEIQLARAKDRFKRHPKRKQIHFIEGNAKKLPFEDNSFDGAFVCWLLEHVPSPIKVVEEAHRVLKKNGKIFINEVLNSTFFVEPYSPNILKYLFEFNDYQWTIKGDPFVGAKLGVFLVDSGFRKVEIVTSPHHFDKRQKKKRNDYLKLWRDIFLSAIPGLLETQRVTSKKIEAMKKEFSILMRRKDALIYWSAVQGHAIK